MIRMNIQNYKKLYDSKRNFQKSISKIIIEIRKKNRKNARDTGLFFGQIPAYFCTIPPVRLGIPRRAARQRDGPLGWQTTIPRLIQRISSETRVKRQWARLLLGWGTACEFLRVPRNRAGQHCNVSSTQA